MQHWHHRPHRKAVRIKVRVRTEAGWVDATVHNVSERGMKLHCNPGLRRNEFVEIARGRYRVVGRIVWNADAASGLRSRDMIDMAGLLADPNQRSARLEIDRRAAPRPGPPVRALTLAERAAASQLMGRAFEKTFMVLALASVSVLAVTSALEAVDAPIEQVRVALADTR